MCSENKTQSENLLVVLDFGDLEKVRIAQVVVEVLLEHDAHLHVQMGLVALLLAQRLESLLVGELVLQRLGYVALLHVIERQVAVRVAHIDEHVGVGRVAEVGLLGAVAAEVGVDGVLLRAAADHLVVELEPLAVQVGADEDHVVAAVVVAAVHEHGVERVVGGRRLGLLQERIELNLLVELVAIVDLYVAVRLRIVLKAHEVQVEHGRKRVEYDALLRLLQTELARVVLVLAIERLHRDVVLERVVDGLLVLDVELYVVEALDATRLVVDRLALDVRLVVDRVIVAFKNSIFELKIEIKLLNYLRSSCLRIVSVLCPPLSCSSSYSPSCPLALQNKSEIEFN